MNLLSAHKVFFYNQKIIKRKNGCSHFFVVKEKNLNTQNCNKMPYQFKIRPFRFKEFSSTF